MTRIALYCVSILLLLGVVACGVQPAIAPTAQPLEAPASADPVDAFLARIAAHCGQSFAGKILTNAPPVEDDPFAGKPLIMHIRDCDETELKIPFHVGDDHSRTWILRRVGERLALKHDHRHADGSPDVLTFYGGISNTRGSAQRQSFPVDQESKTLFERQQLSASLQNTWAMEIEPGQRFLYELSRPSGRLFQVEFDLRQPVATPPAAWGSQD